jgi:predicted TIM-barrel fold metal-dependent hydrolase
MRRTHRRPLACCGPSRSSASQKNSAAGVSGRSGRRTSTIAMRQVRKAVTELGFIGFHFHPTSELGYSDAVMEKVMHGNAERVLGL